MTSGFRRQQVSGWEPAAKPEMIDAAMVSASVPASGCRTVRLPQVVGAATLPGQGLELPGQPSVHTFCACDKYRGR